MDWLSSDARVVLATRAIRAFAYGFLAVLFGLYLAELGFDPAAIGGVLSAALIGQAILTVVFAAVADRIGRRWLLRFSALLMVAAGLTFAAAPGYVALVLAAMSGTIGTGSGEVGPFLTLEQALLPQTVPQRRRTQIFGLYNTVGGLAGALGALAAGLPALLRAGMGFSTLDAYRAMLLLYALLGLVVLAMFSRLSDRVELAPSAGRPRLFAIHRSRGTVARLSALFTVDALAGGFILTSMVALWFNLRFGVGEEVLAPLFFGMALLQAASFMVAARLADRFGMISVMVWSHLPANVLLMVMAVAPNLELAMGLVLIRNFLSQMDVPARQSYTMAVVDPDERPAAAGATNLARYLGSGATPALAGYVMQTVALGLPFFIGGGIKIVYDIALWALFRQKQAVDSDPVRYAGRSV